MKDSFKNIFSFEFWQKFGKALMVVVAVMPAAGLMISIGKSIPMINPNLGVLVTTGGVLEQIGWGVIGNLHILFALAIGGSWAKERAGGAFAAGLSFILINRITGVMFGVTSDMLSDKAAVVKTMFGASIKVSDYFISVLESPALNMVSLSELSLVLLERQLITNTTISVNCQMPCHSSMVSVLYLSLLSCAQ